MKLISALIACLALTPSAAAFAFEEPSADLVQYCDSGPVLTAEERAGLLARLESSQTGRGVLADFVTSYGSFQNLMIQWDSVSYSQVVGARQGRAPAGLKRGSSELGTGVCVHLTRKLPSIEHVADLAHELAHATRLERKVLHGEVDDVDQFVKARLTARGGEADAFAVECAVKHELLGNWDSFCSPYVGATTASIDTAMVVKDFYNGRLSASLTGETYPVMLSRQYRSMLAKKALSQARNSRSISALENKAGIQ